MNQVHKSEVDAASNSETWVELQARHAFEERSLLQDWASKRVTPTHAARALGITLQKVSYFVKRHKIYWPVVKQGVKTDGAFFSPVEGRERPTRGLMESQQERPPSAAKSSIAMCSLSDGPLPHCAGRQNNNQTSIGAAHE